MFTATFEFLLGSNQARDFTIDLGYLDVQLIDLDDMFTVQEVFDAINELHPDRAPGPDGFIGAFYQRPWPIIKNDIMAAVHKLYVCDGAGFAKLNRAYIILIPKKSDAEEVGDFRPISLTHSFDKLFAKMLTTRIRRQMKALVNASQSAFIKGRVLHDNFLMVRHVARRIHARRAPGMFLKLDISKAFDKLS